MRLIIFFLIFNYSITHTFSQVGIGTTSIDKSAILEVKSSNKGFLPPRLSIVERNNIDNPTNGLMIYCKNCCVQGALSIYSNNNWKNFNDCSDLDNDDDGIINSIDIDDDNDGILDRYEDCVGSSTKAFYHTSTGEYIKYDILTGQEDIICTTNNIMGDMAIDEAGNLFGIILSSNPSKIVKINQSNCSEQLVGTINGLTNGNSFSFLSDGSALVGGAENKDVYRITSFSPFTVVKWKKFNGVKGPAGDFVIIKDKLYISFIMPNDDTHLFEVIYDANFQYISHTDLGQIPPTYGFSVVRGRIFSFYGHNVREVVLGTPPITQIVYTTSYTLYGGTALDEVFGECHSANKDVDNDGIPNRFDLDSDNDGCSDAYESWTTVNNEANFSFSNEEVGANGLANSIETEDTDLGSTTMSLNGVDAFDASINCN